MAITGLHSDDIATLDRRVTEIEKRLGITSPPATEPVGTHVSFGYGVPPPVQAPRGPVAPNIIHNEKTPVLPAGEEHHGKSGSRRHDQ